MTEEDEEFNRIEREAKQRMEAVRAAITDEDAKWIKTNNVVCALLRQAHDTLALSSLPMRRKWVGLTRAECLQIEKDMAKYYDYRHECKTVCLPEFAKAIEAKLKEKNEM
jgi:hypothetical protein